MNATFVDITLVVVLAAVLGIIARALKQPTIVAYVVTGVILASFGALGHESKELLDVMATLGITLLLFLVGLQMRFDNLASVGKAALLTGVGQIIFTAGLGFVIVKMLGFETMSAFYIAMALTFSSTIIVVKLLSQKRDLQSLYGRIVIGFLIIQDLVAILLLIFLAGIKPDAEAPQLVSFIGTFVKSIFLFSLIFWLSQRFFPWLFSRLARTPELVFITSIAWAFGLSALVASDFIGLSIEIGGFLAGLALAKSLEQFQIESQLRPLRDFFILIFFIILGSSLVINELNISFVPVLILSLFVLIVNPLIVLVIMGALGYRRKTSFFASVTVAQVSEFSLILMAMGLTLGHVSGSDVSLVTLIAVVTITVSTYFILHSRAILKKIHKFLAIFERKGSREDVVVHPNTKGPIVLAGANRLGGHLLHSIDKQKLVIVEFDPTVAKKLRNKKYKVVFGDITDIEIQEIVHLESAYIVISTLPNIDDNMLMIDRINEIRRTKKHSPTLIVTAYYAWEAEHLYNAGADYVVLPHFVGGKHLATLLRNGKIDQTMMQNWKKHDLRVLQEMSE